MSLKQGSHQALMWALGLSLIFHAGLLTLKWANPATFERVFESKTLEVVLVNSRSKNAPDAPLALAQVNLAGGGQVPGTSLQTSPFTAQAANTNTPALQQLEQKIASLQNEQQRLVQHLQKELYQLNAQNTPETKEAKEAKSENILAERKKQLVQQLAQIEKQSQALQAGPKKRYIGPATQEVSFARYYDKMRRTIEVTGTENFPQAAGQMLYGQLTMVITLDNKGQVLNTEVASGSGQFVLDQRAQAIVRGASPFGAFTPDMKKEADQLVVVTRFRFARDETLETNMLAPDSSASLQRAIESQIKN